MKITSRIIKPFFYSLIVGVCCAQTLWAAATAETAAIVRSESPSVEVVFVLDTTGSMGGLIAAAKEKIWSIANTLASGDPAPRIRMGLVGYRDRGDDYVTTVTPLTDDLDAVYTKLMQFSAGGGGDGPESVNKALNDAVNRTQWSAAHNTYRVVFLVGDAPPHMDYRDDVKFEQSCRQAARKGIIINTIQCGNESETTRFWKSIAGLAEGQFFRVAQSGSAVMYDTPYDKRIADLSRELDGTRIYYGSEEKRAQMHARKVQADEIYEAAAPSAVAKRTIFNATSAGAKNFLGSQELVSDVTDGKVAVDKLTADDLPADMRPMTTAERKKHVAAKAKERQALQSRIDDLARQRQEFIADKVKAEQGKGKQSLDGKIYQCIQTQAAKKNIKYENGPAY